jgi:hypothetical protein
VSLISFQTIIRTIDDTDNTSLVKELEYAKKCVSMLEAQVKALKLQIKDLSEQIYSYARPPFPELHLYNIQDQGNRIAHPHPRYYVKSEESLETPPTTYPVHDTQMGYPRSYYEEHQVTSGLYGHPSKYYQHSFPTIPAVHHRPNGFYYHPYEIPTYRK